MSERWRRELEAVDEVKPTGGLVERARAEGPRHAEALALPSGRSRIIAGVTAFAVFAAAAVFLWEGFHSGPSPTPSVSEAPGGPPFGDGSVTFTPLEGWTVLQGGLLSACATNASFAAGDVRQSRQLGPNGGLYCSSTAAALPPEGIVISASAGDPYRWAIPNPVSPASPFPPTLDRSTCGAGAYEGQPPGTTECHVWVTVHDRAISGYLWFGTDSPTAVQYASAQQGLDAMQVSEPASLGNDIAFEPAKGWYDQAVTPAAAGAYFDLPTAWTSNVPLASFDGSSLPAGPSNREIAQLPANGVIVWVEQWIATRNPLPDTPDFRALQPSPSIADGKLLVGGWEGMASVDVSRLYLRGTLRGRPVVIQAYFHMRAPSAALIKQAQIGLNRLVVVPPPSPTSALNDFGITMQLPPAWHGWLYAGDPTLVATTSTPVKPFSAPQVGRNMGASDTTIVLDESAAIQDLRWPTISGPPQIGPENLCVGCEVLDDGGPPVSGHVLYRNTFTNGGRAFDLYVEFGSTPTRQQLADVNATLRTLRFTPNPSPQQPTWGGTAVGSLTGSRPTVRPADVNRVLRWRGWDPAGVNVPAGWTGWTNLVTDSGEPLNLFAFGSWWYVSQGAYCAPLTALQQLPSDGMLVWIDRYAPNDPTILGPSAWPASPRVGPGTQPAPAPTDCTGGVPVQSFLWQDGGHTYAVHVAFGATVTPDTVHRAEQALASFTG